MARARALAWRGRVLAVVIAVAASMTMLAPGASADAGPPQGAVAVIGDFGSGDDAERGVADLVARAHPSTVVTVGDNVYSASGYPVLVGEYYGAWVGEGTMLPAAGNHDHELGIAAFDAYFPALRGRHVYSATRGGIAFFVLDSTTALDSLRAMAGQRAWLHRALRASEARWKVVVMHHPPYSSGTVHGSSPRLRWPYARWGADLVVSGHEHSYERLGVDGTTFVVDGSGGKDLYGFGSPQAGSRVRFNADFGALFLSATSRLLTGEFWTAGGRRIDRFVLLG